MYVCIEKDDLWRIGFQFLLGILAHKLQEKGVTQHEFVGCVCARQQTCSLCHSLFLLSIFYKNMVTRIHMGLGGWQQCGDTWAWRVCSLLSCRCDETQGPSPPIEGSILAYGSQGIKVYPAAELGQQAAGMDVWEAGSRVIKMEVGQVMDSQSPSPVTDLIQQCAPPITSMKGDIDWGPSVEPVSFISHLHDHMTCLQNSHVAGKFSTLFKSVFVVSLRTSSKKSQLWFW